LNDVIDSLDFVPPDRTGSLAGKRILFFAVRYFGYENQIIAELQRRGAEVDYLPDRPFNTPLMNAFSRYSRAAIMRFATSFYRRKLHEFGHKAYDLVFVINGQTLSQSLLRQLREEQVRAHFLFYIWDSMQNKPKAREILSFFDECITFDPEAATQYGMKLLPLFFAPGFDGGDENPEYDLSFVGTAHSDRIKIIRDLDKNLEPSTKRFWYPFLQAPWVFYIQKLINPAFKIAKPQDFHYEPLPFKQVQQIFRASRAIVDMEHPRQTGLTMRTFEALGAGKKLITTNQSIRNYDFFDPQNIHIIDRNDASVPTSFIKADFNPVDSRLRYKYSLSGWLDNILLNSVGY
jgi:hypothetical protein